MQNVVGTSDQTTSDHRHDLVPGATNRGHSRRQKERQQFVSRDTGEIAHMHELYVSINQSWQGKFPSTVDTLPGLSRSPARRTGTGAEAEGANYARERDASELGATRAAPGQHLPDRGWASANRFRGERGAKPCTSLVPARSGHIHLV